MGEDKGIDRGRRGLLKVAGAATMAGWASRVMEAMPGGGLALVRGQNSQASIVLGRNPNPVPAVGGAGTAALLAAVEWR